MSSQLISYNFCLNSSNDSVSNTLLNMTVFFVSFVCFIENNHETDRKIFKYVTFKMAVFKTVSVKEFVSSKSSWFVYCWNHIIFIDYIDKFLHLHF